VVPPALPVLPAEERHWLEVYAGGVNAAIRAMQGAGGHLPLEFRLLRYEPKPWTARDSVLVALAEMQDLSTSFPEKLDREVLTGKLAPEMLADLYPVGSWRDHPPTQPAVDLSAPRAIPDVPLDESQMGAIGRARPELETAAPAAVAVAVAATTTATARVGAWRATRFSREQVAGLLEARKALALMTAREAPGALQMWEVRGGAAAAARLPDVTVRWFGAA